MLICRLPELLPMGTLNRELWDLGKQLAPAHPEHRSLETEPVVAIYFADRE